MDLFASLSTFIRVADIGSFAAVARETMTSQSAVTRQIAHLEEHFGVRLFHRSTRRLSLTDDGEEVLERARHLIDEAAALEDVLRGQRAGPTGLVRIGVPVTGAQFLANRLPLLLERNPGLSIDLDVNDQRGDMIESRIDVAMRTGDIDDSSLIARRIGVISPVLVAAPSYLARAGHPGHPNDLSAHNCITNGARAKSSIWQFTGPRDPICVKVHGSLRVNNSEVACRIALAGHGIAQLPVFQVIDRLREGRLVRILRDYPAPGMPINLIYPSRRNLPVRTRIVMDFIADQVRDALNVLANFEASREPVG